MAHIHRASISSDSSRAADNADRKRCGAVCLGVRKNGSLRVISPLITARPMVCARASPEMAAAKVCRKFMPTRCVYRWISLTSLKVNNDSGSTENSMSGGSTFCGARIIAIDQPIAAMLNSRLKPSASHGSQPATK